MTVRRQFIAGATCPDCGELDKIQRVDDGQSVWMECVRCHMKKALPEPAVGHSSGEAPEDTITIKAPRRH